MSDHITFAHDHCTIAEDDHHERARERERESHREIKQYLSRFNNKNRTLP